MKPAIGMKYPKGWSFSNIEGTGTVIAVDGTVVSGNVTSLNLDKFTFGNPKVFEAQYGTVNGIWDQIAIREKGGAMLVPFAINPEGQMFVAGGYEIRPLYHGGEKLFTPPGGWKKDTEEKTWQTATREALEECNLVVTEPVFVGETITNRAINIKNEEDLFPTTFFAMRIDWKDLVVSEDNDKHFFLKKAEKTNPDIDKLSTLKFIPIFTALDCCLDGLAVIAFSKTLAAWQKKII